MGSWKERRQRDIHNRGMDNFGRQIGFQHNLWQRMLIIIMILETVHFLEKFGQGRMAVRMRYAIQFINCLFTLKLSFYNMILFL